MTSEQNKLLALTYIQAVSDEDEETINLVSSNISYPELALSLAGIAEIFALATVKVLEPQNEPLLSSALSALRTVLLNDEK